MKLKDILFSRYKSWKTNVFNPNKIKYKKLESLPQKPIAMLITCCDSRINENSLFEVELGDFFVHKNIANIVPKNNPHLNNTATISAIEYAVKNLKVSQIIILGHSNCGGIKYGYEIHNNKIKKDFKYVNKWLDNLRDPIEKTLLKNHKNLKMSSLEKANVKASINNLLTYPFIKKLVVKKKLKLIGLWYEIKSGNIMQVQSNGKFVNIKY